MAQNFVSDITAAAHTRWPVVLPLLGIVVPAHGQHGACPRCGGTDRFRFDDRDGRGTWICNQCGAGDGLDLVKLVNGLTAGKAAHEVAQALQLPQSQQPPARKEAAKPTQPVAETVAALLAGCVRGESDYLTGKGLL